MTTDPAISTPSAGSRSTSERPVRAAGKTGDPKPSRATIRKIAQTALDLEAAAPSRREMLASLLGLRKNTDAVGLVVAIQTVDSASLAPVAALLAIAEEKDPIDAVVAATEMAEDRDKAKSVWALLAALGEVSGSLPPSAARIGGQIAKAAKNLSRESRAELAALRDLLR